MVQGVQEGVVLLVEEVALNQVALVLLQVVEEEEVHLHQGEVVVLELHS